jgi:hypothetical protein
MTDAQQAKLSNLLDETLKRMAIIEREKDAIEELIYIAKTECGIPPKDFKAELKRLLAE